MRYSNSLRLSAISGDLWRAFAPGAVCVLLFFCSAHAAAVEEVKIGGSGSALGTMRLLAAAFSAKNPDVAFSFVPNLGSSGGITAMTAGAINLAATSRPIRENERRPGVTEIEYARSPFVFAVSTKSKVSAVTRSDLAEIYAGNKPKWPDGTPVRIVLRPISDIDTSMVKSLSPEIARALSEAERRSGVQISISDQDAADDLERIPGAIGPTTLALIKSEKRALKALTLDGTEASVHNGASGAYPYFKRMFLVSGNTRPPVVERFSAFVLSPAGRKILADNGHWSP